MKMRILKSWIPEPTRFTFIETRTYLGDTVLALCSTFDRVISIEIDPALHEIARSRVAGRHNVDLVLGGCTHELPKILSKLDGHWSGGATGRGVINDPILVSLSQIRTHGNAGHILFIDDARTFQGGESAPDLCDVFDSYPGNQSAI
jgi:hypothetical protein